jgi:hypothetical protein
MLYAPQVVSARTKRHYDLGGHRAVLLGDIVSAGPVRYEYILAVYDPAGEPCLFVASEVNEGRQAMGGGSHFLGVFPGDCHANYGDSDEWADMERFAERAVALAREQLGGF